jgi:rSAM/selenodomain-associated transferase 1
MTNHALLIFVKNLVMGHVKTRLAATLGSEQAMGIYQQLLLHTHDAVQSFTADKFVFYSTFIEDDIWQNDLFHKEIQTGIYLGERMKNAFASVFEKGYQKTIIIGTDCPGINESILKDDFLNLHDSDIVIGPATDGGYYLLGIKKMYSFLFENIEWSTNKVLQQTINLCTRHKLSYFLLPELPDVDEEKDLIHLKTL